MKMNGEMKKRAGFTLIELMITATTMVIILLGIGVALVDSQRGYHKMYDRVHGAVASDSHSAKLLFDKVIRKSSRKRYVLGTSSFAVFYYSSPAAGVLDRYANFRLEGGALLVDYGVVDSAGNVQQPSNTVVAARNVLAANFSADGACVKMVLKLDDGKERVTITCSALRHND
jgi:Tfp pilus assembly protein PilV